jgi:molybdenum cofactor cytidylyltransferase
MIFGELPLAECRGAILAHSQRVGALMFRKGRILSADDLAAIAATGATRLAVAKLEAGDVDEDAAAIRLADLLAGGNPCLAIGAAMAGRVNILAKMAGVLVIDGNALNALNAIDEAITVATLPPFAAVVAGQMVATIKIIPYAVSGDALQRADDRIAALITPVLGLHPYRAHRVTLIQTELPGIKASVLEKTERVTAERLAAMGQSAPTSARCTHDVTALRAAIAASLSGGAGMVLVIGASAISDRRDVIPSAIIAEGGSIEHFGMPVDPGNLLLLARIGTVPVLGLPGCARSPRQNGCDWVMQRLLAGIGVSAVDIRGLGLGGLLAEIPGRPQPRETRGRNAAPRIAAIILAAGRSSRMGTNKLTLDLAGRPIIAHVVASASAAGFASISVVTGHQAGKVEAALQGIGGIRIVAARDHAKGMAASLRAGIRSLPAGIDAAMVMLGDMPQVSVDLLRRLMRAYNPLEGRAIVLPAAGGKRGNPVIFDQRFFAEMLALEGDVGARHLIGSHGELVAEVAAEPGEIFVDVDTPDAYRQLLAEHRP